MKHTLLNEHSHVDFHDSHVNSVYFRGSDMVWELAALGTHGIVNEVRADNCYIKNAVMTLENARIESIEIVGFKRYESGVLVESKEPEFVPSDEYESILSGISYKHFSMIYGIKDLPPVEQGYYRISVMAGPEIVISFTKSVITWDEFEGREWYRGKLWSCGYLN